MYVIVAVRSYFSPATRRNVYMAWNDSGRFSYGFYRSQSSRCDPNPLTIDIESRRPKLKCTEANARHHFHRSWMFWLVFSSTYRWSSQLQGGGVKKRWPGVAFETHRIQFQLAWEAINLCTNANWNLFANRLTLWPRSGAIYSYTSLFRLFYWACRRSKHDDCFIKRSLSLLTRVGISRLRIMPFGCAFWTRKLRLGLKSAIMYQMKCLDTSEKRSLCTLIPPMSNYNLCLIGRDRSRFDANHLTNGLTRLVPDQSDWDGHFGGFWALLLLPHLQQKWKLMNSVFIGSRWFRYRHKYAAYPALNRYK